MSNYSKTTDFEAKDSLPTGDSGKIIRGAEFETEFDAISTAIATKADTAGPTFTGTLTFETISDGTIDVTAFVDEDDMSSDSATLVPTQQSVKAYVDSQVTAQDLDFQADSGGALSIDLDSETMTFTGGTGIDTSGLGNAVTFAIDSTVATLTGTQTLTNKTLTSPDVNTPDIDGGTIDGTVIGGTTAAAGSFTTVSATGNITVDGTVDGRDVATDGTKLDGIESGATADQTAAEIRTLVDSATDSNVFTDADHSKLDGIEAGADVTDTANVTAAGALMDSELTSEASVKALNQGVATTDSPTFAGVTVNGTVEFDGLSGTGAVSVTDILDQDDMSSNSATALATQQSIKAYVDSQVATADTLSEVLANGNTTGGTDIAVGTGDDITFADSSKAIFGAGSDLQIYHTGSHSFVQDTGSGDLYLATNGDKIILRNTTLGESFFEGTSNGDAKIFYNGLEKLTTTSAGIDVTGTAVTDGLTVDVSSNGATVTAASFKNNGTGANTKARLDFFAASTRYAGISGGYGASAPQLSFDISGTDVLDINSTGIDVTGTANADKITTDSNVDAASFTSTGSTYVDLSNGTVTGRLQTISSDFFIGTATTGTSLAFKSGNGVERLRINSIGDISFYEDTGTTAKLFWDASAESLGIGTSSPSNDLHISSSTGSAKLTSSAGGANLFMESADNNTTRLRWTSNSNFAIRNDTTSSDVLTINQSGHVGIGTSSPSTKLHVNTGAAGYGLTIAANTQTSLTYQMGIDSSSNFAIYDSFAASQRMVIDTSGNVGIGTSSPGVLLDVSGATPTIRAIGTSASNPSLTLSSAGITAWSQTVSGSDSSLSFNKDGSEKMRIDSNGNLLVGKSDAALSNAGVRIQNSAGTQGVVYISKTVSGTVNAIGNYHNGTYVGGVNYSDTATSFPTSSDQRLKDNIVDAPSASDDIDAIQVRSFDWKADGSHQKYGMVAQELQRVAPEAVTGDADSDDMMGIDYSKLVPMLVKEIQSLRARVAQLEGEN